jgi:hypothetical protein
MPILINKTNSPINVAEGTNSAIIAILQQYKIALPIGFIASRLGRRTTEIELIIQDLEENKIIKKQGDKISLIDS